MELQIHVCESPWYTCKKLLSEQYYPVEVLTALRQSEPHRMWDACTKILPTGATEIDIGTPQVCINIYIYGNGADDKLQSK
jgi:hypothetical protein